MRATSVNSIEQVRSDSVYENITNRLSALGTYLYIKGKESAETEDIVIIVWALLVVYLVWTGYSRFSECGKIIGTYKALRF
jgi:hypothetical protein